MTETEKEERRREKIAAEVTEDFERRWEARRSVESGWLLNMNFFSGNQYCDISPAGGIVEEDKRFTGSRGECSTISRPRSIRESPN